MRTTGLLVMGMLVAAPFTAAAQDMEPAAPQAPEAPAATEPTVAEVLDGYTAAERAWRTEYAAARKEGRRAPARPSAPEWGAKLLAAVERTDDGREATRGLGWIAARVRTGDVRVRALKLSADKYLEHPGMGAVANGLASDPTPSAAELLRTLVAKNPSQVVQGQACYALAKSLRRQASVARYLQGDTAQAGRLARTYGQPAVDVWAKVDADALEKEAEGHFEVCVAKFGDTAFGKTAKRELYELRNLSIGKTAPEIVGTDQDGEAMKLSDYRGKVVVVDFWGDW